MTLITLKKATIFVAGLFLFFVIALLVADGFFLPKEYLDPWSKTYHEQFEDLRIQVLAHGVLASNSHNLQSGELYSKEKTVSSCTLTRQGSALKPILRAGRLQSARGLSWNTLELQRKI